MEQKSRFIPKALPEIIKKLGRKSNEGTKSILLLIQRKILEKGNKIIWNKRCEEFFKNQGEMARRIIKELKKAEKEEEERRTQIGDEIEREGILNQGTKVRRMRENARRELQKRIDQTNAVPAVEWFNLDGSTRINNNPST